MSRTSSVPAVAEPLVESIRQAKVFTRPTFPRFLLLMACLIVTMGRHTVSRALKAMGPLLDGHWSNYHRLYSQARYSMWKLAVALLWSNLPQCKSRCQSGTPCYAKATPTFADAPFAVRGVLWREALLVKHLGKQRCFDPPPKALRETLVWHLTAAA